MKLNKELIELRIKDLLAKGKELETQLHQINGALQQCEWTLNELKEQENAFKMDCLSNKKLSSYY